MKNSKTFGSSSRFVLAVLFFGLLFACVPAKTYALTLTPLKVETSGNPGDTITAQMTLINDQSTTTTYYSSYANFEAQGDSGTPSLVEAHDDLGTWMAAPMSVVLPAGGEKTVDVRITIPKDAAPGGHFAAVFWGTAPDKNTGKIQVGVSAKTGVLVLLRVNGDIPESGGVTEFNTLNRQHFFTALPVSFYYRFQNGGGDRIKPVGDIVVKNMLYITAKRVPGNPVDGNVLPGSTRKFTTNWVGRDGEEGMVPAGFFAAANYEFHNFAFGRYGAHLKMMYGTKDEMTNSVVHFWVFPWQLIVFVLVLLLIISLLVKSGLYHYNKWVIGKAEEMLEEKEEAEEKAGIPHHLHHHEGEEHVEQK